MSAIVLGVSGGIAAFKAASLLRLFTEAGHDVQVLPTHSALQFVGAPTWEALSGHPVRTSVFSDVDTVAHVKTGQNADLIVVAPATANLVAKAAAGIADDMLTTTLLTARCPIVFAPAMHTEMWDNPATQANVSTLRSRGYTVLEPAVGRLTGPDSGKGRLPDPEHIFAAAMDVLQGQAKDMQGMHLVISAGGTREPIDPVRWIGNRSSGKQGFAIAEAAISRGAQVTLVAANVLLPTPASAQRHDVETVEELRRAMLELSPGADAVIMAAAPADFRPVQNQGTKIKKTDQGQVPELILEETPDILAELVSQRVAKVIVGFAAETGDEHHSVAEYARRKLQAKGCDLLVLNDVSAGKVFGSETNAVSILSSDGRAWDYPQAPKSEIAHYVCDAVIDRMGSATEISAVQSVDKP